MTSQPTATYLRGKAPAWTALEDDTVRANHHLPIAEILPLVPGRTYLGTYQRLRKLGFSAVKGRHGLAWSDDDVAYLHASYGKVPSDEMCDRLKRKEHAIHEYARRQGLKMAKDENGDTVNTVGKAALRRLLDGSLQSYYWMGYLMADGYMHHGLGQIVLVSAEADKDHMATYAAYLGSKVHRYENPSYFTGLTTEHHRVSVADYRVAVKIAEKFDWKPRKTYNPPRNEVLAKAFDTDDQFLAFFIGFVDGDGSINKVNHSIRIENHASWITFHTFLLDSLRRVGILDVATLPKINGKGYSDFHTPKRTVQQLKHFIEQHQLTVLTRKWDKVSPALPPTL